MKNFRKMAILLLLAVAGFYACSEGERFGISSDDTTPPAPPVFDSVQRLPGGARFFYKIPDDEDLISIEASFTSETTGKVIKSAVSLYAKSLELWGFADTTEHVVQLYAVDRAGNKSSNAVNVPPVKPLEPAFTKVAESLTVKPAFAALMLDWENDLQQNISIYVDLSYSLNGSPRSVRQAISSRKRVDRQFIKDLDIPATEPVKVQVTVADAYGNESKAYDMGTLNVMRDSMLNKKLWTLPVPGTEIGVDSLGRAVYMSNGSMGMGKNECIIDGILENDGVNIAINVAEFNGTWNVEKMVDGVPTLIDVNNRPPYNAFNVLVDLGAYYEISRITTHQKWTYAYPWECKLDNHGWFYEYSNVQIYRVYWLDGDKDTGVWRLINEVFIEKPTDMSELEMMLQGIKGDEAFMYPDDPKYTPRTRYFRYEAIERFRRDYASPGLLSEITLFGRKAQVQTP
ncbi:DUF4959 domain-containing protein [Candidatus Symbiothrix dinenymphae]|uniref:DUF4959 domain-containing protein n=1 Tax=Candidatus Symbiothrix dinenymphae TaxID=467085 RepID=UPI0007038466|nr:DUF4959 domain-containing protein [Candidatus Symbiothrix dinenymphae]